MTVCVDVSVIILLFWKPDIYSWKLLSEARGEIFCHLPQLVHTKKLLQTLKTRSTHVSVALPPKKDACECVVALWICYRLKNTAVLPSLVL